MVCILYTQIKIIVTFPSIDMGFANAFRYVGEFFSNFTYIGEFSPIYLNALATPEI